MRVPLLDSLLSLTTKELVFFFIGVPYLPMNVPKIDSVAYGHWFHSDLRYSGSETTTPVLLSQLSSVSGLRERIRKCERRERVENEN